mmetsp:Transcript_29040/g.33178  ORF Transcript_29040/g.33178 Transcript_29040/m.33178 type:complete len:138 (-) Transcript_29040:181-594(-)
MATCYLHLLQTQHNALISEYNSLSPPAKQPKLSLAFPLFLRKYRLLLTDDSAENADSSHDDDGGDDSDDGEGGEGESGGMDGEGDTPSNSSSEGPKEYNREAFEEALEEVRDETNTEELWKELQDLAETYTDRTDKR